MMSQKDKAPVDGEMMEKIRKTAAEMKGLPPPGKDKAVEWPSERIAPGGLFHSPKVEYSKETADLIRLLMEESKLSMTVRRNIDYHLRNGEPLPKPKEARWVPKDDPDAEALAILERARNAKRKSLKKIMSSGAFEASNYKPRPNNRLATEEEKKRLQEAMSGLRQAELNLKAKRRPKVEEDNEEVTQQEMINELLDQIEERASWLAEMEELGEGKKYRDEIREQIAFRVRKIRALEGKMKMRKNGFRFIE